MTFRTSPSGDDPKSASGTYNALYIHRGGLYTNLTQSFIYFETVCYIEEKYE